MFLILNELILTFPLKFKSNPCPNQIWNLQWPRNHLKESDQRPEILSRFSFAPEDETVILYLDAEENYPLGNQLQESDQGRDMLSRLTFTPDSEASMLDLGAGENYIH